MHSAHPQLNTNANNSNNNVAGPTAQSQRRWVPPSRDRRSGGSGPPPRVSPGPSDFGPRTNNQGDRTTLTNPANVTGGNIPSSNTNIVKDIPPNTTYSKFSASLAASHAQAISSGGGIKAADRELSRNDVAFRKVSARVGYIDNA